MRCEILRHFGFVPVPDQREGAHDAAAYRVMAGDGGRVPGFAAADFQIGVQWLVGIDQPAVRVPGSGRVAEEGSRAGASGAPCFKRAGSGEHGPASSQRRHLGNLPVT